MLAPLLKFAKTTAEFAKRTAGAVVLRTAAYRAVRDDAGANGQALLVAALAAGTAAAADAELGWRHMAALATTGIAHWCVWSATAYWIGVKLLGCAGAWGGVARSLGFAKAPGMLAALAFVPWVGGLLHAAAAPWMLATGVAAARVALGAGTGRALLAAGPGVLLHWMVLALLY